MLSIKRIQNFDHHHTRLKTQQHPLFTKSCQPQQKPTSDKSIPTLRQSADTIGQNNNFIFAIMLSRYACEEARNRSISALSMPETTVILHRRLLSNEQRTQTACNQFTPASRKWLSRIQSVSVMGLLRTLLQMCCCVLIS